MIRNTAAMISILRDSRMPVEEIELRTQTRLRKLLIYAYDNIPYYHHIMQSLGYNPRVDYSGKNDLKNFPILSRDIVREEGYSKFISKRYNLARLHSDRSSGSMGKPMKVWRDPWARSLQVANWLRVLFVNNYRITDKVMSFTAPIRLKDGKTRLQNLGILRRQAISAITPPDLIIKKILHYEPDVLYGNRSTFDLLMKEMSEKSLRINSVKLILLGGEIITERIKEACMECFGILPIEYYGLVETGILAYETPERNGLHLNEDQVHYEFLNSNGEPLQENQKGKLVVTRLSDRAMPFIRYDVGDQVTYQYVKSDNDVKLKRIKSVNGRDNEIVVLPDGKSIPYNYIARIINKNTQLRQYRIIQERRDFFRILIVGEDGPCSKVESVIMEEMDQLLKPLSDYTVERVPDIPLDDSGKYRALIPYNPTETKA